MPKVRNAFSILLAPKALDIIELPPIPIPIPMDEIRKAIGSITVIAAMAKTPIHCPTKMVSTIKFKDITIIPMVAGTACFINNLLIFWVPKSFAKFVIRFCKYHYK